MLSAVDVFDAQECELREELLRLRNTKVQSEKVKTLAQLIELELNERALSATIHGEIFAHTTDDTDDTYVTSSAVQQFPYHVFERSLSSGNTSLTCAEKPEANSKSVAVLAKEAFDQEREKERRARALVQRASKRQVGTTRKLVRRLPPPDDMETLKVVDLPKINHPKSLAGTRVLNQRSDITFSCSASDRQPTGTEPSTLAQAPLQNHQEKKVSRSGDSDALSVNLVTDTLGAGNDTYHTEPHTEDKCSCREPREATVSESAFEVPHVSYPLTDNMKNSTKLESCRSEHQQLKYSQAMHQHYCEISVRERRNDTFTESGAPNDSEVSSESGDSLLEIDELVQQPTIHGLQGDISSGRQMTLETPVCRQSSRAADSPDGPTVSEPVSSKEAVPEPELSTKDSRQLMVVSPCGESARHDCIGSMLGQFSYGDNEGVCAWATSSPKSAQTNSAFTTQQLLDCEATRNTLAKVSHNLSGDTPGKKEAAHEEYEHTDAQAPLIAYNGVLDRFEHVFTASLAPVQARNPSFKRTSTTEELVDRYETMVQALQEWCASHQKGNPCNMERYYRVGHNRSEVFKLITNSLCSMDSSWKEILDSLPVGADLLWNWSSKAAVKHNELLVWQRINHYPEIKQLTRKDLLKRHLERCRLIYGMGRGSEHFNLMPQTYILPSEYAQFIDAFTTNEAEQGQHKGNESNIWIMKPVGLSRGRGIFIVDDLNSVVHDTPMVVQKYVSRPLLVSGHKFDLRLYCLITSFQPLEAFVHTEGFARFSAAKYSTSKQDLNNNFIHLTNSSIQRTYECGGKKFSAARLLNNSTDYFLEGGSKCSLKQVLCKLEDAGVDTSTLWKKIKDTILRSLFAVQASIPHQVNSFELLGFDVLVDEDLKPWIIEANTSPSLEVSNELDAYVKEKVIRDTVALLDPLPFNRSALLSVLKRRLSELKTRHTLTSIGNAESRKQLNVDLSKILYGRKPRSYGDMPTQLGCFERVAPSKALTALMKLKTT
mmetsp:Transcript_1057/g.3431  ORF Transcript_1057/g.3431 Transcript_1057/m.3431 type:complete len:998 (-) Transcript_1057:2293-5286(-)